MKEILAFALELLLLVIFILLAAVWFNFIIDSQLPDWVKWLLLK